MIRNLLALTGLLAVALAASIALQAYGYFDDDDAPRRLAVSYAGLDLATPQGIALLEDRIDDAIDRVCPDDRTKSLRHRDDIRECRDSAVASVRPQVDRAVAAAERRAARLRADGPPPRMPDYATGPSYAPPPPPPPPPVDAPQRLVRRTVVTTRTVTTTRVAPPQPLPLPLPPVKWHPAPPRPAPKWHPAPAPSWHAMPSARPIPGYARRAPVSGSWLPPAAWAAIDRATLTAFATGKLTRWNVAGREGYVLVSPARRVGGDWCRNVQAVKYTDDGRQLVVASGMRCRGPGGALIDRAC